MYPFEDYSSVLQYNAERSYYEYSGCENYCIIPKDSLGNLMEQMQQSDIACISALNPALTKEQNLKRCAEIRRLLREKALGLFQLACLNTCDEVERMFLIERPEEMPVLDFRQTILECMNVVPIADEIALYRMDGIGYMLRGDGLMKRYVSKEVERADNAGNFLDKLRSYSFMGVEMPATNLGRQMYTNHGIRY